MRRQGTNVAEEALGLLVNSAVVFCFSAGALIANEVRVWQIETVGFFLWTITTEFDAC